MTGKGTSGGRLSDRGLLLRRPGRGALRGGSVLPPSSFAGSELGARVIEAVVDATRTPSCSSTSTRWVRASVPAWTSSIARHPDQLVEQRGLGLMNGLETRSEAHGPELTRQCFRHGLLAIFAFNRQSTLQVMPPLVIDAAEMDELLERLGAAVAAMQPLAEAADLQHSRT